MKKILFVGAEVMPFAATGGLGDVLGSLPAALAAQSRELDIRVVMPLYAAVSEKYRDEMKTIAVFDVHLAWRRQYCGVRRLIRDGVTYYFIDNEYYFARDTLYGHMDDGERYAYFCRAVLEMMPFIDFYPDVLHAHDWQAALSVIYYKRQFAQQEKYAGAETVFTIHNIAYQGIFGFDTLHDVFALSDEDGPLLDYDGQINLMKAAIVCADRVTTVSPRYAQEILTPEYSHRLHYILRENTAKLCGILNGIDYVYYNPAAADDVIVSPFDSAHLENKIPNKTALQRELGLPVREDVPLLAIISRLASHKGLDLVVQIAYRLLEDNDVQLVVLGKGEAQFERFFRELEQNLPDRVRALMLYDRDLSKRIYAACDIFLMPSRSEPCGLSQMIASRYGAIPVVRETGGLYDSIKGYWEDADGNPHGNGFTFANYSSAELLERANAAIRLWNDPPRREALVKRIMETDFSWNSSAREYRKLYQ